MFYMEHIYRRHEQRLSYIIIASLEANQNRQKKKITGKFIKPGEKCINKFFAICKLNNSGF